MMEKSTVPGAILPKNPNEVSPSIELLEMTKSSGKRAWFEHDGEVHSTRRHTPKNPNEEKREEYGKSDAE